MRAAEKRLTSRTNVAGVSARETITCILFLRCRNPSFGFKNRNKNRARLTYERRRPRAHLSEHPSPRNAPRRTQRHPEPRRRSRDLTTSHLVTSVEGHTNTPARDPSSSPRLGMTTREAKGNVCRFAPAFRRETRDVREAPAEQSAPAPSVRCVTAPLPSRGQITVACEKDRDRHPQRRAVATTIPCPTPWPRLSLDFRPC